ncbi:MAG: hypothetical protein ACKVS6_13020 [Planctomycetota bacterium]
MRTRILLTLLLTVLLAGGSVAGAGRATFPLGDWKRLEGYGMLVERGPLGRPAVSRELVLFMRIFSGRIPTPDLLAISIHTATGTVGSVYRIELRDGSRQPVAIEPHALRLDANRTSFRIESSGETAVFDNIKIGELGAAPDFTILRAPSLGGSFILPYWAPAVTGSEPTGGAKGVLLEFTNNEWAPRTVIQQSRRDDSGNLYVDLRTDGSDAALVASAQFSPQFPLPVWGQVLDSARKEQTRFRLVMHSPMLARALSLGRGRVAGDPLLLHPELLFDAETVWYSGSRDLIAENYISQLAAERKWVAIEPRSSPALGEVVPFAYELFAVQGGVKSGTESKTTKTPSTAAPRGAVGLIFAGRFEAPSTRLRYEAWIVPGSDERAQESDPPNPLGESTGRLLLRLVLGNAASGLLADRGFQFRLDHGWYNNAKKRGDAFGVPQSPKKGKNNNSEPALALPARRGSDAILLRRENDLSPVALVFYRLSDDLRSVVSFAQSDLDGTGSASVVRRSLLERAKDFFLAGGFSAFTTKKGSSILLTRTADEGTVVDRIADRSCSVELLEESDMPPEPWLLQFDPKNGKNTMWGTSIPLAVGRNRFGDARLPRDGVLRRTDGEELVVYESWDADRPWWSEAIAAYPQQGVGVRFRPLVHARQNDPEIDDNDGQEDNDGILPFEPPPLPPQPIGNPKTPRDTNSKPKPTKKPEEKKPAPAPAPAPGTGPKTGG